MPDWKQPVPGPLLHPVPGLNLGCAGLTERRLGRLGAVDPDVGFLAGTIRPVPAVIEAVEERLTDGQGVVFRYCSEDHPEGEE